MTTTSSFLRFTGAALLALSIAACSGAGDDTDMAGGGAAGLGGAAGTGGALDPTSVEYFQITVGDRVFFITDSSSLTADAQATLRAQAQWLTANPARSAIVEGHADERGTREYNLALGARRASAARAFLLAEGVDASRLRSVTYGKERPEALCAADSCWSQNRRAVTVMAGPAPMS
ncbi:MAG: peptidoglycan-associated lipoprotein [Paracoccaceae bacterium]|jgi:peptidoglycan-associated lipoprotein